METNDVIKWIGHASFIFRANSMNVFVDPFSVSAAVNSKADIILITHAHFDHCSKDDIDRVRSEGTKIVAAPGCLDAKEYSRLEVMRPGQSKDIMGVRIEAVPAYNTNQARLSYHPRQNDWVGYVVDVDGMRVYHAGDTDFVDEMKSLSSIDLALLPIGGKYTMDVGEAISAADAIGAKRTVPMHYKSLLGREGSMEAEKKFLGAVKGASLMHEIQEPTYAFKQ